MDAATLLDLADLNLIEFNREIARSTAGGVVHEQGGLVFVVPGHRFPVGFSGVMRSDTKLPAAEAIDTAREWFAPRGQGYTWFLGMHRDADLAEALESAGISRFSNSPGMACDHRLDDKPLAAGVTIEQVATADQALEFATVSGTAYATYGMPPKVALKQFADHRFFTQPHVAAFLARVDGVAAAAALTMVSHGVSGIYWVGTTPEARGRGLAEACTRTATNAGFDLGARVAALQASVMGEPIYLRMGYREITRYPWYVVMP